MQPPTAIRGRARRPRLLAGMGARCPDRRQVNGVDTLINASPQRGRGGDRAEHLLAMGPQLADSLDTVRAVGHRGSQITSPGA
jgi:hypothetical protein